MDDLTPSQRKALEWLVERALAKDIDGEEFHFGWANGFYVADYPTEDTPRDIKRSTMDRLAMNMYLHVTQLEPSFFRGYIEDEAYNAVRQSKSQIRDADMSPGVESNPSAKRVFVSYASEDKALVDALVDLLQTGAGISADNVFAFSLAGQGIPPNAHFVNYIRNELKQSGAVLALISPYFSESAFCLCELGAAWVLSENLYPLVIPPLTPNDLDGVLLALQATKIDDAVALSTFAQHLVKALGLPVLNVARWEAKRNQFIERLNSLAISRASDDDSEEKGPEELSAECIDILKVLSSNDRLWPEKLAEHFNMSVQRMQYFLDLLSDRDLVRTALRAGGSIFYLLSSDGRALLYERGLL